MIYNILLVGGTGSLGNALQKYNQFQNIKLYAINTHQIDTNNVASNITILKIINQQNINCIIDFARNNKKQLVNALLLFKQLPDNIRYIHISTYGIEYPNVYPNEAEYNFVKYILEKNLRAIDCAIRLPIIVDKNEDIIWDDIATDYTYIASFNDFTYFLFNVILNNICGKLKLQAKKVFKYA